MTHDHHCSCAACASIRWYLENQNGDEHPACCVCPLCAESREYVRRASRELNDFGTTYQSEVDRAAGVNSWWQTTTQPLYPPRNRSVGFSTTPEQRAEIRRTMEAYLRHSYRAHWPYTDGAAIDPLEPIESASDAVDAFDLLHELGIPIRKDET
jgi:hypothetical protein